MSWRVPTEDDLLGAISSAELAAYRAAAISEDQTDPVTLVLSTVISLVRGYCAGNSGNVLGPAGTIPAELIGPAMDYLAVDVVKRLPGRDVSDDRDDARKAAIALFRDVAAGRFAIQSYGAETAGGAQVEEASSTTRLATRDTLKGL